MASGNFCTWNSLTGIKDDGSSGITFANGNTSATMTHNGISCLGTHGINSGKWYYEINYHADGNYADGRLHAGWTSDKKTIKYAFFSQAGGSPDREGFGVHLWFYRNNSQGGKISYQSSTDYTGNTGASNTNIKATAANNIIMCAIDADNHKMYWGINGNWGSTNTNGATATNSNIAQVDGWSIESTWQGSTWQPAIWFAGASSGTTAIINAGQDSSFSGTKTSGSANASDSNSIGNFYYTPPTNFLALSSANLPISEDIDPSQTDDNYGAKNFNTVIWTGNQSTQAITGVGFKPDLVWLKQRAGGSNPNIVVDSTRGVTKRLEPNANIVEGTDSDGLTAFGTDGFTLGSNDKYNYGNGWTYVAWCWKANGGTTSSNTDGALTSTVQANQAAGFSISKYTCNGSGESFGHGLGAAPDFFQIKKIDNQARNWMGWHTGLTTATTGYIQLNSNAGEGNDNLWTTQAPSNTVIHVKSNTTEVNNPSGDSYICYAWRSIPGYSRFGKYEGNADNNGTFVYLGFRPRMVCIKSIDSSQAWIVCDTARETFNPLGEKVLQWNTNDAEYDPSGFNFDALSNGFKIRSSDTNINAAQTYIYMAWADVSFKYNQTF